MGALGTGAQPEIGSSSASEAERLVSWEAEVTAEHKMGPTYPRSQCSALLGTVGRSFTTTVSGVEVQGLLPQSQDL